MPRLAKAWKFNPPLWQNEEHFRTENFYILRCLAAVLTHESRIAEESVVSLNFGVVIWKTEKILRLPSNSKFSKSSLTTHDVCFGTYNFVSSKATCDGKFSV